MEAIPKEKPKFYTHIQFQTNIGTFCIELYYRHAPKVCIFVVQPILFVTLESWKQQLRRFSIVVDSSISISFY